MSRLFKNKHGIEPDEIFMDSRNLPEFNVHQFEGRIEQPIQRRHIIFLGLFFLIIGIAFFLKVGSLQVVNGKGYAVHAENNTLRHSILFSERGVVYDRNDLQLVWNLRTSSSDFSERKYIDLAGLAHTLGYVNYPQKDSSGFYYKKEYEGIEGIEKKYNNILSGQNGTKIVEVDVFGNIKSESTISTVKDGDNLRLTIDAEVQNRLYEYIKELSLEIGFNGGAGVIMNVNTGEILATTSYPEYDSSILSSGNNKEISKYILDERKPFLNRAISGLYTPGSTVKPFFALAALQESLIEPTKEILSTGSISIQNPYFPELKTVFNDWKAHGWVDMRDAIAVSSNVYFFEIGGGYEDQRGLGIEKIEDYSRKFGLGEKTDIDIPEESSGIIPNPKWKAQNFEDGVWRVGDTYNTSIGQYGFQITPMQLARAVSALANNGKMLFPRVLDSVGGNNVYEGAVVVDIINIDEKNFQVVREGMRQGVTDGVAKVLSMSEVSVAAKTGTAEVGAAKKYAHSWISGFFPYEEPKYAFAVVMEKGPRDNLKGAVFVMRNLLKWMSENTPEYL